jgi:hypothetical protein
MVKKSAMTRQKFLRGSAMALLAIMASTAPVLSQSEDPIKVIDPNLSAHI